MLILTDSYHYVPVLVDPKRFEDLWKKDGLYLPNWGKPPRDKWFHLGKDGKRIGFIAGLAAMGSEESIGFTNGRHRTRWLLEAGLKELPICIPHEEHDQWMEAELILVTRQPIQSLSLAAHLQF